MQRGRGTFKWGGGVSNSPLFCYLTLSNYRWLPTWDQTNQLSVRPKMATTIINAHAWGTEVTMCVRVCICNAWISCGEKIRISARPTHFHSHLSADLAIATRAASHQPCCPLLCIQTANNSIRLSQPPSTQTQQVLLIHPAQSVLIRSPYHITGAGKQPLLLGIRCSNNTVCLASKIHFRTPILWPAEF